MQHDREFSFLSMEVLPVHNRNWPGVLIDTYRASAFRQKANVTGIRGSHFDLLQLSKRQTFYLNVEATMVALYGPSHSTALSKRQQD